MKITIIIIVSILLILSNVFWMFQLLDSGISVTHRSQYIEQLESTNKQLKTLLPAMTEKLSKEEIISIADTFSEGDVFEKEGYIWLGDLGFKFNGDKLISVVDGWSF